jgi:hypothetical protein
MTLELDTAAAAIVQHAEEQVVMRHARRDNNEWPPVALCGKVGSASSRIYPRAASIECVVCAGMVAERIGRLAPVKRRKGA